MTAITLAPHPRLNQPYQAPQKTRFSRLSRKVSGVLQGLNKDYIGSSECRPPINKPPPPLIGLIGIIVGILLFRPLKERG